MCSERFRVSLALCTNCNMYPMIKEIFTLETNQKAGLLIAIVPNSFINFYAAGIALWDFQSLPWVLLLPAWKMASWSLSNVVFIPIILCLRLPISFSLFFVCSYPFSENLMRGWVSHFKLNFIGDKVPKEDEDESKICEGHDLYPRLENSYVYNRYMSERRKPLLFNKAKVVRIRYYKRRFGSGPRSSTTM